jgi:hypothetical protein
MKQELTIRSVPMIPDALQACAYASKCGGRNTSCVGQHLTGRKQRWPQIATYSAFPPRNDPPIIGCSAAPSSLCRTKWSPKRHPPNPNATRENIFGLSKGVNEFAPYLRRTRLEMSVARFSLNPIGVREINPLQALVNWLDCAAFTQPNRPRCGTLNAGGRSFLFGLVPETAY